MSKKEEETKKTVKKTEAKTKPKAKAEVKEQKAPEVSVRKKTEEKNVVFVGAKPTMNYVLAVMTVFNQGANDVILKARGRATSRAVDVAEVVMKKFLSKEVKLEDITIGTDTVGEGNDVRNLSTIEITLKKK